MTTPVDIKPEDVPEWATSGEWDKTEKILDQAEEMYQKLAEKLDLQDKFGKFIIISCTDMKKHVIGDTEAEADALWQAEYGDDNAALFQIGDV